MSLWLDFLGTEIRTVATPTFGRIRIAEAGRGNKEVILFQHGLNGHLEAYAKNLIALSAQFHATRSEAHPELRGAKASQPLSPPRLPQGESAARSAKFVE